MNEEKQSSIVGGPMAPDQNTPVDVVDVQFRSGSKVYYFDPGEFQIKTGDHVIIETARGPEYGICAGGNHQVPFRDIVPPLRKVLRLATEADERTLSSNLAKEKRAFEICQQKIREHKLDMQLVSAEYAFDGSKILFFFTADDRVDFRELVKNLAGIFRTRIELRQIGVRDKAKMVGGLGICGRPFCCSQFLEDFQPVSIKMAKTQNLSLNPTKISGTCGRLMCCLKYEQEAYEDLLRTSPKSESFVDTPDGRGTVTEVNLLRQCVKVRMEDSPDTIGCYHNCDICVLRNGKAKKTDPPIPTDLAPISGNGKRPRPTMASEEPPMQLDPIRFRYRPDDIVEETPPEEAKPTEERRRKRRNEDRPHREPKQAEIPETQPTEEGQEPRQHSANHRRSRPKPPKPQAEAHEAPAEAAKPVQSPHRHKGPRPQKPKAEHREAVQGHEPPKAEGSRQEGARKPGPRRRRPSHRPKKPGEGGNQGE